MKIAVSYTLVLVPEVLTNFVQWIFIVVMKVTVSFAHVSEMMIFVL